MSLTFSSSDDVKGAEFKQQVRERRRLQLPPDESSDSSPTLTQRNVSDRGPNGVWGAGLAAAKFKSRETSAVQIATATSHTADGPSSSFHQSPLVQRGSSSNEHQFSSSLLKGRSFRDRLEERAIKTEDMAMRDNGAFGSTPSSNALASVRFTGSTRDANTASMKRVTSSFNSASGAVKTILKNMFVTFDKDDSGFISAKDARGILSCFGVAATREDIQVLIRELQGFDPQREELLAKRKASSEGVQSEVKKVISETVGLIRNISIAAIVAPFQFGGNGESITSLSGQDEAPSTVSTSAPAASSTAVNQRRIDTTGAGSESDGIRHADLSPSSQQSSPQEPSNQSAALLDPQKAEALRIRKSNKRIKAKTFADDEKDHAEDLIKEIDFEFLVAMFFMWQSAGSFRMFEERSEIAKDHISVARGTLLFQTDGTITYLWQLALLIFTVSASLAVFKLGDYTEEALGGYFAFMTNWEAFFTAIMCLDVIAQLHTVVVSRDEEGHVFIRDNRWEVFRELVKFWFWVDVLAMIPFRFFFLSGGTSWIVLPPRAQFDFLTSNDQANLLAEAGCNHCVNYGDYHAACTAAFVVAHLRVLKLLRFMTWFKESGLAAMEKRYIQLYFVMGEGLIVIAQLVVLVLVFSWLLCFFNVGGEHSLAVGVYNIMTVFSTTGYGTVVPEHDGQRWFFCLICILAAILNGVVIGSFVEFFQRSDVSSKNASSLLELSRMLDYFYVPSGLQDEIIGFYSHTLSFDILGNYGALFHGLPVELQKGLELWSRLRIIQKLPYFDDLHSSARLHLCDVLVKVTFLPEEYIVYHGEIGEEMFFLNEGFVDIYTPTHTYITTLRSGAYFGEMAIMSQEPQPRGAHVKAISYCEVFVLGKTDFVDILNRYPKMRKAVEELAKERERATAAHNKIEEEKLKQRLLSSGLQVEEEEEADVVAHHHEGRRGTVVGTDVECVDVSSSSGEDDEEGEEGKPRDAKVKKGKHPIQQGSSGDDAGARNNKIAQPTSLELQLLAIEQTAPSAANRSTSLDDAPPPPLQASATVTNLAQRKLERRQSVTSGLFTLKSMVQGPQLDNSSKNMFSFSVSGKSAEAPLFSMIGAQSSVAARRMSVSSGAMSQSGSMCICSCGRPGCRSVQSVHPDNSIADQMDWKAQEELMDQMAQEIEEMRELMRDLI